MLYYSGSGFDTLIIFDYNPLGNVTYNRALKQLADLIGLTTESDVLIVGEEKAPLVSELKEGDRLDVLTDIYNLHTNIVFSGRTVASQIVRDTVVTSVEYEVAQGTSAMSASMRLTPVYKDVKVTNRRNKNLRVVIKPEEGIALEKIEADVRNLAGEIIESKEKVKVVTPVGKISDMIYNVLEHGGKRIGFTEGPKFWQNKIYEELHSILKRDVEFVRNGKPLDMETEEFTGTLDEFIPLFDIEEGKPIGFDIETTGVRPWEFYDLSNTQSDLVTGRQVFDPFNSNHLPHKIISFSVASNTGKGWSVLLHHPRLGNNPHGLEILKWICSLENPKVIHNAKFEYQWVQLYYGIKMKGIWIDTMINEHILNEGMASGTNRYSLKGLTAMRLGMIPHKGDVEEDIETDLDPNKIGLVKEIPDDKIDELRLLADSDTVAFREKDFTLMDRETLHKYAATDAVLTLRLLESQMKEFGERGMSRGWNTIAKDLCQRETQALGAMEYNGFKVNSGEVMSVIAKCDDIIKEETTHLEQLLGKNINFSSNMEMTRYIEHKHPKLADRLERTKRGDLEISIVSVKKFKKEYPWLGPLFELRHAYKTKGTYMIPFLRFASAGRVHFEFHIAGPATGRLSSSRPNMQNIPMEISGIPVKTCLRPEKDQLLVNIDLSGAEMRMLANYSRDKNLMTMLREDKDSHSYTASGIYGVPYEDIEHARRKDVKDQTEQDMLYAQYRQNAKPINFGIVYGITGAGVSRQLDCSEEEGHMMISKFYDTFPGIRDFLAKVDTFVLDHGYAETFMGRRRSFPLLTRYRKYIPDYRVESMLRKAKNFIVQGGTSDFFQYLIPELLIDGITPHITVHDSLSFSLDESILSLDDMKAHFHHVLVERPKQLWPEFMALDMKFDIEVGYAYGSRDNRKI